jgi:homoserine O-acetyltransferase
MSKTEVFHYNQPFELETGASLPSFQLQYTTAGTLNEARDNVVWVCHALSGSSEFQQWWPGVFDNGSLFDPNEYYIVCANVLGGCYGSTGPLEINSQTGKPYFHQFPFVTNRDVVNSFELLRKHLGISKIDVLIGGSLGGQHALEWAIMYPSGISHLIGIATNAQHSPWGIAFNESQRMAIENDSSWTENHPKAGENGLKTARTIAMLSYRNPTIYDDTQVETDLNKVDNYKASSYQRYQGEKIARRFNAFTYWTLSKMMDSHNVGRGRQSVENGLSQISAKCIFIGLRSDILFPMDEQIFLAANVKKSCLDIIDSKYGHDGFLVEIDQLTLSIKKFYQKRSNQDLVGC